MRFYGGRNLAKAERDLVLASLKQCSNNRVQTAKVLGMPRSTLDKKLKQYAASGVPVPPAQNGGFRAARWSSQGDRASGEVSNRVADSDSAGEILTASDSKAKFTCRCCGVSVEADAGRCYRCGVAYPTSELRAVALSPTAIPFYVVAVLAFITLWFSS